MASAPAGAQAEVPAEAVAQRCRGLGSVHDELHAELESSSQFVISMHVCICVTYTYDIYYIYICMNMNTHVKYTVYVQHTPRDLSTRRVLEMRQCELH